LNIKPACINCVDDGNLENVDLSCSQFTKDYLAFKFIFEGIDFTFCCDFADWILISSHIGYHIWPSTFQPNRNRQYKYFDLA